MGRERKWKIVKLTQREINIRLRKLEELERLDVQCNIKDRLRKDWDLFLEENSLDPGVYALRLFIADMTMSLSPSSAHEYCSKLSQLPVMKLPGVRGAWRRLNHLLNILAADSETTAALNITHATAEKIIDAIENPLIKNALRVMVLLGPRAKDLTWLRRRQLDIPKWSSRSRTKAYRARILVAKNRKHLSRRVNLTVPMAMRSVARRTGDALHRFLETVPPEEKLFATVSTPSINKAIAGACVRLGLNLTRAYTTYSFRRLFISEVIRYCKRDFGKCMQYTLHFEERTIKAYYDAWGNE